MCSVSSLRRVRELRLIETRQPGIGEADWEFKTTFDASEEELAAPQADLVFDGLDTFATVTLVQSPSGNFRDQATDCGIDRMEKSSSSKSYRIGWLSNAHGIGRTVNQFVTYRVPVKDLLKAAGNELSISFESAFRKVCRSYLPRSWKLFSTIFLSRL